MHTNANSFYTTVTIEVLNKAGLTALPVKDRSGVPTNRLLVDFGGGKTYILTLEPTNSNPTAKIGTPETMQSAHKNPNSQLETL